MPPQGASSTALVGKLPDCRPLPPPARKKNEGPMPAASRRTRQAVALIG
jgi:hypothetical protein